MFVHRLSTCLEDIAPSIYIFCALHTYLFDRVLHRLSISFGIKVLPKALAVITIAGVGGFYFAHKIRCWMHVIIHVSNFAAV